MWDGGRSEDLRGSWIFLLWWGCREYPPKLQRPTQPLVSQMVPKRCGEVPVIRDSCDQCAGHPKGVGKMHQVCWQPGGSLAHSTCMRGP